MYKIIYVDEHQDDIDDFLDYFEGKDSNGIFQIEILFPKKTIEEMIESVFEQNPDAIITDYLLNDYKETIKYNVPYTGIDISEKIKEIKKDFPCFVLTSYDNDAIKDSKDVNIVYIKDILHGSEEKTDAKSNFLDKVEYQIKHYQQEIEDKQQELLELIEKSNTSPLDAPEEEKLLQLDNFIVEATNKKTLIPSRLKEKSNLEELHKMIENTDALLEEWRAIKDEK